jgi:hypothetical protein
MENEGLISEETVSNGCSTNCSIQRACDTQNQSFPSPNDNRPFFSFLGFFTFEDFFSLEVSALLRASIFLFALLLGPSEVGPEEAKFNDGLDC